MYDYNLIQTNMNTTTPEIFKNNKCAKNGHNKGAVGRVLPTDRVRGENMADFSRRGMSVGRVLPTEAGFELIMQMLYFLQNIVSCWYEQYTKTNM